MVKCLLEARLETCAGRACSSEVSAADHSQQRASARWYAALVNADALRIRCSFTTLPCRLAVIFDNVVAPAITLQA